MNSLVKSIFISTFPVFALIALADSLWFLFSIGFSLLHVAHLLTAFSISFFFVRVFVKPLARTDSVLKIYTFFVFLGCILSLLALNLQEIQHIRITCVVFNIVLTVSWIMYLVWYSFFQKRNAKQNTILQVGNTLPVLEFENVSRHKVSSKHFAGTPSIFIFYRGNWCPFCMAQIKEMVAQHEELTNRNIHTVFISSQPHSFSKHLTKTHPLDFQFLTDVHGKVAKQLHIFDANGLPFGFQLFGFTSDTVLPTVIITDSQEKIVYTNQTDNYRVRPEPTTLLKIIDANV